MVRLSGSTSVLALGGALLGIAAVSASAETDPFGSAQRFFYQEQLRAEQPAPHVRHIRPATPVVVRSAPAPRPVVETRPRPIIVVAPVRKTPAVAAVGPARKIPPVAVEIYGDRLGQVLARGLDDADGTFAITSFTSEDAGLTRADFTDWLQTIRARLQKPERQDVAIMMLGSNDHQPLPDGDTMVDPTSPRWDKLYAGRIDAVAATFRDAHVPLVWVGLPSVHREEASADFVRLNALFRDRAGKDGIPFVDSFEAFNDDTGAYSPIGPDVDGQIVKLRKADGFGFTRAGARKLASFVEPDLKRFEGPSATPEASPQIADITIERTRDFDSALDIDVNAQIEREVGLKPDNAALPSKPAVAALGPAAGAIIPLTGAPASPDGQLATMSAPPNAQQATLVVKATEDSGDAATPQAGRTDDFAWPKP